MIPNYWSYNHHKSYDTGWIETFRNAWYRRANASLQVSSQRFRNLHPIPFSDEIRFQPLTLLYLLAAMEIPSKLRIQHANKKLFFPPKNRENELFPMDFPNGPAPRESRDDAGGWLQGQDPHTRVPILAPWRWQGSSWMPQFTCLGDQSCSELSHRDVSTPKVSKTSNKIYICTSFYSFGCQRDCS